MTGFEPATFCTQNKRATKLRYIPTFVIKYTLVPFFMKEKKNIKKQKVKYFIDKYN